MNKDMSLTPETVVSELRRIADRIENSRSPSLTLVGGEIVRLARRIADARSPLPGRIRDVRPAVNGPTDVSDDAAFDGQMKRFASKKR